MENLNDETKTRFYTVYDVSCINVPCEEIYKPLIEYAEPITDIYGYCQYMLHQDFDSFVRGKKRYECADIQPLCCDSSSYSKFFEQTEQTDNDILDIVYQLLCCSDGNINTFIQLCQMHSNPAVLKYVQKHAYFVHRFLLSPNIQKIVEKEYLND